MGNFQRAGHMDVSNTVDVSDAVAVAAAVQQILGEQHDGLDLVSLRLLFEDFSRLYCGDYPGFRACDINYHNEQHVLDVTLAMARLLDGRGKIAPLSAQMILAGIAAALFHDSGYIRRTRDTRHANGAAYTRVHVSRSARFLTEYLPSIGLQDLVGICTRLVYFTRTEVDPAELLVLNDDEWVLGTLLGTADLMAQMADKEYVQKCREHLYEEFVAGGMAGEVADKNATPPLFDSPEQLLRMTPGFISNAIDTRLNQQFKGVHRFAADHFDGRHLYMEAIAHNSSLLEEILAAEEVVEGP
ncbi:MAG: hypothetical protein ACI9JM_000223 [Halioglobus sp.]|jgi:hypothetical protein